MPRSTTSSRRSGAAQNTSTALIPYRSGGYNESDVESDCPSEITVCTAQPAFKRSSSPGTYSTTSYSDSRRSSWKGGRTGPGEDYRSYDYNRGSYSYPPQQAPKARRANVKLYRVESSGTESARSYEMSDTESVFSRQTSSSHSSVKSSSRRSSRDTTPRHHRQSSSFSCSPDYDDEHIAAYVTQLRDVRGLQPMVIAKFLGERTDCQDRWHHLNIMDKDTFQLYCRGLLDKHRAVVSRVMGKRLDRDLAGMMAQVESDFESWLGGGRERAGRMGRPRTRTLSVSSTESYSRRLDDGSIEQFSYTREAGYDY